MTQRVVNYTYDTGNPVLPDGSIDVRDGIDNLQSFDVFMNAQEDTYNQRDGEIVQTVAGAIRSVGFKPGAGDFTTGFTVMPGERDIAWYDPVSKNWYSYLGVIPTGGYVVAPTTNPVGNSDWVPRTDELLRSDLASPSGASLVHYGADTSAKIFQDISTTPDSMGAVGDGVTNNDAAMGNVLATAKSAVHLRKGMKYLVNTFVNKLGMPMVGKGALVKSVTGGLEMQNSYADHFQRMTGQENLAHWFKSQLQPAAAPRIVFSGDSTTAGDGTSANFKIHLLVKQGLRARGLITNYGTTVINKGHSGATTAKWASTYVTQDIADNPDLYVVRWGINGVKDVTSFATDLRAGLATYRNAKPFANSSILLMMPNSTYDIPNGRDAKWYEQLRDVYVQAARDYRCAFIDTYALMQNSKGLANILMDDPYADGRGIHPNDMMNSIISGYILEMIAPTGAAAAYGKNNVMITAGGESATISASLLPAQYDGAISFIRTMPASGWPLNGNAITFKAPDGTFLQYVFGYKDADRGKVYVRFGRGVLAGETEGWSEFMQLGVRVPSVNITPSGGYQAASSKVNKTGTVVVIDGKMIKTTPGNITTGTTIGIVPVGFRPTRDPAYGVATMINAGATSFVQVPINVATDGQLSVAGSASNVAYIYLSISYDITP